MVTNFVAPSPSATTNWESCCAKSITFFWSSSKEAVPSVINSPPAAPFANAVMVSLVDMSPSTEIQLKDASVAWDKIFCNAFGSTGASVTKNPNNVAMFGQIIPAPLANPAKRYSMPLISKDLETNFGNVSVVQMALAHSNQSSCSPPKLFWINGSNDGTILSIDNLCPMTPVDITNVDCPFWFPTNLSTSSTILLASLNPPSPVTALAHPALTTIELISVPLLSLTTL